MICVFMCAAKNQLKLFGLKLNHINDKMVVGVALHSSRDGVVKHFYYFIITCI